MDGIGTTTWKWEVELRREQQPRVESGTEAENNAWTMFMEEQVSREGMDSPKRLNCREIFCCKNIVTLNMSYLSTIISTLSYS